MALADDIRALRDRALAELNAAHDYYADTKFAWDMIPNYIAAGNTFTNQNPATGTVTTHADLIAKAPGYVTVQLAEATFQQFISIFENFISDLVRIWLLAYPKIMGRRQLSVEEIVDAPDKEAILLLGVNKELHDLTYDRPTEWFEYLNEKKLKLGCPTTPEEIARIVEAKATRDVLVHNRGVANKTYEAKAGPLARYKAGEQIDIPDPYHREIWELLRKVVADIGNAALAKAP